MNSKMSKVNKKKKIGGGLGKADSKIVSELQLNMNKLLEDMRKSKIFEHETGLTFRKIEKTLEEFRQKNNILEIEHGKIK